MNEVLFVMLFLVGGGFIKTLTTLQIFRVGLGLYGTATGLITALLAFVFSFFVVSTIFPVDKMLEKRRGPTYTEIAKQLEPFLEKHTTEQDLLPLQRMQKEPKNDLPTRLLAFSLKEVKEAFQIGLLFLLPFLIIDIVVVHLMQLLAVTQISAWAFSLPLKLGLFIAIDGWTLIATRLLGTYLG